MENQLQITIGQAGKLCYIAAVLEDKNVCMMGAPGIGKSDVVRQVHQKWCEQTSKEPWYFDAPEKPRDNHLGWLLTIWSQHDITDLKFPAVMNNKMVFHYSTELPLEGNEERFPKAGIWGMGEITNTEPYMQKALMQIILERRLGTRRVLPGWKIIADGNRASDRSYTVPTAPPLANRILWLNVTHNTDDWVKWALEHQIDPRLIAFVRFRPNLLHHFDPALFTSGEMAFPSPRQWAQCNSLLGYDSEVRVPLISGLVGQAACMEFESFVRVFSNLPDIPGILKTGKGKVPKDQATLLAVVASLVTHAKDDNLGNIFEYVGTLPGEHQMLFAKDVVAKSPIFVTHTEYNKWATTAGKNLL